MSEYIEFWTKFSKKSKEILKEYNNDYNYEVLLLFMLGAVTRVFKPGTKFKVMLCLVGGQGAGKSTFFRFLAVRDEWFSDDLRKLDDDNVYRKLQGRWIIEMSTGRGYLKPPYQPDSGGRGEKD